MFEAVAKNNILKDVTRQIEKAIVSGHFKPGDRLPSERALRDSLEVSRATLRESLRVLEARGMIDIKIGARGGAYVKPAGVDHITDGLSLLIRQKKVSLEHLYEFRISVEGIAAGLAVERASDADLDQMEIHYGSLRTYFLKMPEQGQVPVSLREEFYLEESRLHGALARISGNPIYEWVLSAVGTTLHEYVELLPDNLLEIQNICDDWKDIINAMRLHRFTRVRHLVNAHVMRANVQVMSAGRQTGKRISNILLDI